jgi:quinol monooxygenase YgiN
MSTVLVRHRVNDYEVWKEVFDNALDMRKAAGELSFRILVGSDDQLLVVGLFEWDSAENAKVFFEDPELKEAMRAAGVAEEPQIRYLELAFAG